MNHDLKSKMGEYFAAVGLFTRAVWGDIPVNRDEIRQCQCSSLLATRLGYDGYVCFKAGTFAQISDIRQQPMIHTDVLNDVSEGYERTRVLSYLLEDKHAAYYNHWV